MKKVIVLVAAVAMLSNVAYGVELLTNPGLDALDSLGNPNPALYYDLPVGWTIDTDPCSYSPCAIVRYPGYPAGFADREAPGGNGVVFNSTEGDFPGFPDVIFVDADLKQSVPGTPGTTYQMSGYAYFEGGYAGGVDTIATGTGTTRAGLPSLTRTYFALEFLDASNAVLPGSVVVDLRADGQVNNPDVTEATRNWLQHTLTATAPVGTVNVQVRASMVDGEFNIDMPHQAAWVDDFSLTAVPEPATCVLGLIGIGLAGGVRRRR